MLSSTEKLSVRNANRFRLAVEEYMQQVSGIGGLFFRAKIGHDRRMYKQTWALRWCLPIQPKPWSQEAGRQSSRLFRRTANILAMPRRIG